MEREGEANNNVGKPLYRRDLNMPAVEYACTHLKQCAILQEIKFGAELEVYGCNIRKKLGLHIQL